MGRGEGKGEWPGGHKPGDGLAEVSSRDHASVAQHTPLAVS